MSIWSWLTSKGNAEKFPPIRLFNTLTGSKEDFQAISDRRVRMYNCGPTVYDLQHIGNFRAFIFADLLRRTFQYNGYTVQQVLNITDVGHLTSDADEGEDKVEKRARESGKRIEDIVSTVTEAFFEDLLRFNVIVEGVHFPRASEHIGEQIALVRTLEDKGYTYRTSDGIYFDTSRFPGYGKLGKIDTTTLLPGARVPESNEKRNSTDFALWKFSKSGEKRQQEWDSPWGVGFPGWHIECSAMSMKYLGRQLDVHTGGIDHIPIHHNNEIAQSEAATGKPFVRYWLHVAFITIEGKKIAKSVGNTIYVRNIVDRGFSPLAYRYWLLTGHYRTPMNFTWQAIEGAHEALFRLHRTVVEDLRNHGGVVHKDYQRQFAERINDDLDTPSAVALMWQLVKDGSVSAADKRKTLLDFDRVFGIGLRESNKRFLDTLAGKERRLRVEEVPESVAALVEEREQARKNRKWERADQIRSEIRKQGFDIDDTDAGTVLKRHS